MTDALLFGVSQYTTGSQCFEEDIPLFLEMDLDFIEVCESKLDTINSDGQLQQFKESGLEVSSVQPRLHSLFPDFPRPEPKLPRERMGCLRKTIELFDEHFPNVTINTISGAAPHGDYALACTLEIFSESNLCGSLGADPRRTAIEGKKVFARIWEKVCD